MPSLELIDITSSTNDVDNVTTDRPPPPQPVKTTTTMDSTSHRHSTGRTSTTTTTSKVTTAKTATPSPHPHKKKGRQSTLSSFFSVSIAAVAAATITSTTGSTATTDTATPSTTTTSTASSSRRRQHLKEICVGKSVLHRVMPPPVVTTREEEGEEKTEKVEGPNAPTATVPIPIEVPTPSPPRRTKRGTTTTKHRVSLSPSLLQPLPLPSPPVVAAAAAAAVVVLLDTPHPPDSDPNQSHVTHDDDPPKDDDHDDHDDLATPTANANANATTMVPLSLETTTPSAHPNDGSDTTMDIATVQDDDNDTKVFQTPASSNLVQHIQTLRQQYQQRLLDTIQRGIDGLPEEDLLATAWRQESSHDLFDPVSSLASSEFPDAAIPTLVQWVEGQCVPLESLVARATQAWNHHPSSTTTTPPSTTTTAMSDPNVVAAKIQLLATRNHLFQAIRAPVTKLATKCHNVDATTTTTTAMMETATAWATLLSLLDQDRLYRWEVVTPSVDSFGVLFPVGRTLVKKARAARKKIALVATTLVKLLTLLSDLLPTTGAKDNDDNDDLRQKLWARVHLEEEKIQKMDREYEAQRIAERARIDKLAADRQVQEELAQRKQQAALAKQQKKEEAALARQKEKEEAALARQKEKELKQQQQQLRKEEAAPKKDARSKKLVRPREPVQSNIKQQHFFKSFLKTKPPVVPCHRSPTRTTDTEHPLSLPEPELSTTTTGSPRHRDPPSFEVATFRNSLTATAAITTSLSNFSNALRRTNLSARAHRSRQRRERVSVPVFVTFDPSHNEVDDDNPFLRPPAYAEQVQITISNRYKFLSFCEDVRPPYYGTWSKKSKVITGKTPFGIDTLQLDYDVDSEGEWEEEEDDIGEEIGDDAMEDDEEKELDEEDEDDEDDGWLAADDDIDDEDDEDEEDENGNVHMKATKNGKRKIESLSKRDAASVCIISPYQGRPLSKFAVDFRQTENDGIDGISPTDAADLLHSFVAVQLCDQSFNVDAYPPPLVDESDTSTDPQTGDKAQPMSEESMKTFVTFVHNCTYGSKDKVLDELLQAHPSVTNTRAQAYRLLDTIAEKKKHPCDGSYFWEVKADVLDSLGLTGVVKGIAIEDVKQEAMKIIVRCVHNSTLASKEKMVDEIRSRYEHVTASRAEAMRIVQSIATKVKHPNGGCYWIVNEDIRKDLGLDSLPNNCPTPVAKLDEETGIDIDTTEAPNKRKHPTLISQMLPGSEGDVVEADIGTSVTVNILPPRKKPKSDNNEHGSSKILAAFVKKSTLLSDKV